MIATNRRAFLRGTMAGASALAIANAWPARAATARREVRVGGKHIKTVDVHAHCVVDTSDLVKGTQYEKTVAGLVANKGQASMVVKADRLDIMNQEGVDVQALTINPFWYDGTDNDCSGGSDFDQDGDGVDATAGSGLDCDDTTASTHLRRSPSPAV